MGGCCLLFALLVLAGCGNVAAPNASTIANVGQAPASGTREAALAAITDRCGLPRTALRMNGDMLVINPPADAGPAEFDCLLREIPANSLTASLRMGFVGNEYRGRDNGQAR